MVFKLARTFANPTQGAGAARGFPAPGDGEQTIGDFTPAPDESAWQAIRPIKGRKTWRDPVRDVQQGFPSVEDQAQRRPMGSMPNRPPAYGLNIPVTTPYFSRGAAATVQNYGKIFTNPIGAGVVALHRPLPSYGSAGQYVNGAIWWTSQAIPTSFRLQGLNDPDALAAVLGPINVQAVVRTTG